jgi:hypothetical protein
MQHTTMSISAGDINCREETKIWLTWNDRARSSICMEQYNYEDVWLYPYPDTLRIKSLKEGAFLKSAAHSPSGSKSNQYLIVIFYSAINRIAVVNLLLDLTLLNGVLRIKYSL